MSRVYSNIQDAFVDLYPTLELRVAQHAFSRVRLDDDGEDNLHNLELSQAWCTASAAYYKSKAEQIMSKELKDHRDVLDRLDAEESRVVDVPETQDHFRNLLVRDFEETIENCSYEIKMPEELRNRMSHTINKMNLALGDTDIGAKFQEIANYVKMEYRAWRDSLPPGERVSELTANTAVVFKHAVNEFELQAQHARNVMYNW